MNSNEMDKNKINRVVTPIKIDSAGNPIVNRENKEIVIVKKEKKTGSMTSVQKQPFVYFMAMPIRWYPSGFRVKHL